MVIFIHGLNSSCETDKYKAISDKDKVCENFDHSKPEEVEARLVKLIQKNKKKNLIIVGHSIGAFWARKMAKEFNLKALLLNPSLVQSESVKEKIGPEAAEYYDSHLHPFEKSKGMIMAVLESGDERVDQKRNAELLKAEGRVIALPGGYHRFSRVADIDGYIKRLQNNFT